MLTKELTGPPSLCGWSGLDVNHMRLLNKVFQAFSDLLLNPFKITLFQMGATLLASVLANREQDQWST